MKEIVLGYVWIVDPKLECLDIRRYHPTHSGAVAQVNTKGGLKGWSLFKLVRVNKRKAKS